MSEFKVWSLISLFENLAVISVSLVVDIMVVATLAHMLASIIIGGGRGSLRVGDWESDLVSIVDRSSFEVTMGLSDEAVEDGDEFPGLDSGSESLSFLLFFFLKRFFWLEDRVGDGELRFRLTDMLIGVLFGFSMMILPLAAVGR